MILVAIHRRLRYGYATPFETQSQPQTPIQLHNPGTNSGKQAQPKHTHNGKKHQE